MGVDNLKQSRRRINLLLKSKSVIKKSRSNRKKVINERWQTAYKKKQESKKTLKAKNAQKERLLRLA